MRIKKYAADTMPEALKLVRADLGPRAVILNTRTVRKSGKLGLRAKGQVEVTAAVDDGQQQAAPKAKAPAKPKAPASGSRKATAQSMLGCVAVLAKGWAIPCGPRLANIDCAVAECQLIFHLDHQIRSIVATC